MINLSTGPVAIRPEVRAAFALPSISHRSPEFMEDFKKLTNRISLYLGVKETYLLTGSGTLANEAMIWQIKLVGGQGLVLSNGEFGDRLVQQAQRAGLSFKVFKKEKGMSFSKEEIEEKISSEKADWVLCCHCETSSGQLISLSDLYAAKRRKDFRIYMDCMSSFATMDLDLSGISLATASSGKGIGSFAGLALVFSNLEPVESNYIPGYFDLSLYKKNQGVPFTISSNLVKALDLASELNISSERWNQLDIFSKLLFSKLHESGTIPFANEKSRVFTIVQEEIPSRELGEAFLKNNLITSYQSGYLAEKNWIQLALMGNYDALDLEIASRSIIETVFPFAIR